jgi:hypothetical protein
MEVKAKPSENYKTTDLGLACQFSALNDGTGVGTDVSLS